MKIKKLIRHITLIVLATLPFGTLLAQKYPYAGFASEHYFGRELSTRAEAMGKGLVSLDGDATSIHFNPAGLGNLDGIELSGTYATPYYVLSDATKQSINVASRITEKLAIGISRNSFLYNKEQYITDGFGTIIDSTETKMSSNKLSVAYRAESTFFIGGTLGLTNFQYGEFTGASLQFDFGVVKKFKFSRFRNEQSLNLATTFKNPLGTQMELSGSSNIAKATLPISMQSGVSYYYSSEKEYKKLNSLKLVAAVEYQTLFNSQRVYNKYSAGLEVSLLEILHLRGGYYLESSNDYGSSKNKRTLTDFTYGLGLSAPIDKLTDLPMSISIDYCTMPQPSYTVADSWDNFQSVTARLSYTLF